VLDFANPLQQECNMRIVILALLGSLSLFTGPVAAQPKTDLVFIGTYTNKVGSKGIYRCEFDPATGKLSKPVLAIESSNPSFLAIHPSGKWLYAVNEDGKFEGKPSGAVSAFGLDRETGKLELINQKATGGPNPCHVVVHPQENMVAVANYNGGGSEKGPWTNNFAFYHITGNGGLFFFGEFHFGGSSVDKGRQQATHPHSVNFTPDGKFLLLADLGTDKVTIFPVNFKDISLSPKSEELTLKPGAGPRHLDLNAKGDRVYVVNELNSTVTVFDLAKAKDLQTISTLPKDADAKKNFPAEIRVHRELGYVYASNRGHDSIAVFKINKDDGTLTAVGHVQHPAIKNPRGFTLHGNYLIAAGQNTNKIVVFRIDPAKGNLKAVDEEVEVPVPVCIRVLKRT
jgi:6-phosphogluconolactonase